MSTIRPIERKELERALDLWEGLMRNGADADPRFALAPDARAVYRDWARETWFLADPFARVLVAVEGGFFAGFVHMLPVRPLPVLAQPPTARIADLWVEAAWRRRGIGRALVSAAITAAKGKGFDRFEVGTLTHDERAVAFWRSVGFRDYEITLVRK